MKRETSSVKYCFLFTRTRFHGYSASTGSYNETSRSLTTQIYCYFFNSDKFKHSTVRQGSDAFVGRVGLDQVAFRAVFKGRVFTCSNLAPRNMAVPQIGCVRCDHRSFKIDQGI